MCEAPGTGILRFDREARKLFGVVACGCGERPVPISGTADGPLTVGIDYEPQPQLDPPAQGSPRAA